MNKVVSCSQVTHSLRGSQLWQKPKRQEASFDRGLAGDRIWKGRVEKRMKAGSVFYIALGSLQVQQICPFLRLRVF